MSKQSKKNNSPEQKAQWTNNKSLGVNSSKFIVTTPSTESAKSLKEPSKRDLHRMDVKALKNK